MSDRGPERRSTPGEGGTAARRADPPPSPDEHQPVRPGESSSEATEPRFRRRGRAVKPPRRRRRQLATVAAVLVPVAFVLMRGRGPEPPPPSAQQIRREEFLDWIAHEDRLRVERHEARFRDWTLKEQEVDDPATRNRLQRFLDDLGTAFRSLIN